MPLTLEYHGDSAIPVSLDGVTPDRLAGKAAADVERVEIVRGHRRIPLAELFRVAGDLSDGSIEFAGHLRGVHDIGRGMAAGVIRVRGDAGRFLGAEMSGGMIEADGDCGDWVGAEMKGGLIRIAGSVGDHTGAAFPGSRRGMTDGTILIGGAAGDECGRSMRRGTIAIGGSCGHDVATGMIAGTILVHGPCGDRIGAGMRRGTIALFGPGPVDLLPTFRAAGRFRPLFFELIRRELARLRFPVDASLSRGELSLYHGDFLSLGKGEVWLGEGGEAR
jgi:formylmethanofuran dehydrogenase subunit C